MSNFPIVSIIAIVLGAKATKLIQKADNMAAAEGRSAGSQRTTARVFSLIGIIVGSIETAMTAPFLLLCVVYLFYAVVAIIFVILYLVGIVAVMPSLFV